MKKLILAEFIVLLAGTLFAWGNFTLELISWLNNQPCTTGCSATQAIAVNPFFTPCFFGAIFFTIALILSSLILKKAKKNS